jgi:hypothetical protein
MPSSGSSLYRVPAAALVADDRAWTEAYEGGRQLDPDRSNQIAGEQLIDLRRQLEVGSAGLSLRQNEMLRLGLPD